MSRIEAVALFTMFSFLIWLYVSANHSTIDDWWTVKSIREITLENEDITIISPPNFTISPIKVLSGLVIFIILGIMLSLLVMKRRRLNRDVK
ncbi:hypothetical protein [Alkalibacillus silvisoli]|uniref:DUF4306 domain-containing protein n=1 Tax=Alkalibacillus silvisoli TaxID=392823 RepID=A0ABP3JX26_9BACI